MSAQRGDPAVPAGTPGLVVARRPTALLRYPVERDRDAFLDARRRSREALLAWEPSPAPGADVDDPAIFERAMGRIASLRARSLVIEKRASGEIVGAININEIVMGAFRSAYLGYWVATPWTGRGLATAGVAMAIDHAFADLGLHRLEANIQPANGASIGVARRCALRREGFSPRYLRIAGRWADHERWAITAEEWAGPQA